MNDIWTYLPDDGQRWYFTSEMDTRRAYVFNPLPVLYCGTFDISTSPASSKSFLRSQSSQSPECCTE